MITYDGPEFVKWLEEERVDMRYGFLLTDWDMKLLKEAREGSNLDIYKADNILTHADLHLHLIPDRIVVGGPNG
jgi:hypothetical protein